MDGDGRTEDGRKGRTGLRLLEVHLEVGDLDLALEFYRRLLNHEKIIHWSDGSAVALVFADGSAFGLWKRGKKGVLGGRGGEHVHFAFRIESGEYDEYHRRLLALDVKVLEHEWNDGSRSLYFFDADGHQGEFMTKGWI